MRPSPCFIALTTVRASAALLETDGSLTSRNPSLIGVPHGKGPDHHLGGGKIGRVTNQTRADNGETAPPPPPSQSPGWGPSYPSMITTSPSDTGARSDIACW